ncbi:MAG: hypothetical protein ACC612_06115 [Methanomethylovorans sp.]|uniref:hypothetical protein n=1 Tax=Methanomethylovorans sp. TaxID=2758717 RepID=UPI003530C0C5
MGLIESLTGNFFILNASLLLTVMGLVVYWFGIFYNKMSSAEVDKTDHYTNGALFLLQHVVFPIFVYLMLKQFMDELHEYLPGLYDKLIDLISASHLWILALILGYIFLQLSDLFESYKKLSMSFNDKQKNSLLIRHACSILIVCIAAFATRQRIIDSNTPDAIAIIFSTFIIMTAFAILEGLSNLPFRVVTIETDADGPEIGGTVLKDGAYVHLFTGDKKIKKINKDSIRCINVHRYQYYEIRTVSYRIGLHNVRRFLCRILRCQEEEHNTP